ncbi:hypothetical protein ACFL59_12250 [Planctomycetota bacterium]
MGSKTVSVIVFAAVIAGAPTRVASADDGDLEDWGHEVVRMVDQALEELVELLPSEYRPRLQRGRKTFRRLSWAVVRMGGTTYRVNVEPEQTWDSYQKLKKAWTEEVTKIRSGRYRRPEARDKVLGGNAAVAYREILERFAAPKDRKLREAIASTEWVKSPGQPPPEPVRAWAREREDLAQKLRQATSRAFVDWELQYEDGLEAGQTNLLEIRLLGTLLLVHARLREKEDPLEAARIILDTMRFGHDVSAHCTLVGGMMSLAVRQRAAQALVSMVQGHVLDGQSLGAVRKELRAIVDAAPSARAALQTDRLLSEQQFHTMVSEPGDLPKSVPGVFRSKASRKKLKLFMAAFLLPSWVDYRETCMEAERLCDRPFFEAARPLEFLSQRHESTDDLFLGMLMPSFSDLYEKWEEGTTRLRLLNALLACEACRCENGSLPKSWADVAPFITAPELIDPFVNARFVFKSGGDGILIYSRGRDRDDDGGFDPRYDEDKRDRPEGDRGDLSYRLE